LGTDISKPVVNAAGAASRTVLGDATVEAVKSTATKVAEIAATDVREIPEKLRQPLSSTSPTAISGTEAVANAERTVSATPKHPATMTPAERQAYADAVANEAAASAATVSLQRRGPSEFEQLPSDFRQRVNSKIEEAKMEIHSVVARAQ